MKRKGILGLFIAVTLTVGTMEMSVSAKNADDFGDVKPEYWYYDVVKDVAEKELMTGMNDSYFGASELLAKSHVACVLYRMDGKPQTEYQSLYPDVADRQFYSEAVTWANQINVITGYENGKFGPADNITREQLVTIMYRYAELKGKDVSEKASLDSYADGINVSPFATEAMKWAIATGVIKGEGDSGLLNPQGNVSRAVCATIISRFSGDSAAHQHVWNAHTATKQVWVSKMVTVDDYEQQQVLVGSKLICSCGAEDSREHALAHAMAGEEANSTSVPIYETQNVKVGSHQEDHGSYKTESYTDYYYCDCGATK